MLINLGILATARLSNINFNHPCATSTAFACSTVSHVPREKSLGMRQLHYNCLIRLNSELSEVPTRVPFELGWLP